MYTASFGLRCSPFEDRADAAFFFPAAQHEEAIAAMQYEVQHGDGVALILGETGTGKTMLIRSLSRRLSELDKVVILTVPSSGTVDILREACKGFGVSLPSSLQDARGLVRLRRHLSRNIREGSRPVLIIDQAEHLSPGDLNDIESLLEFQNDRGRLLRIVLAAHPRFRSLIEQPAFSRLRQLAFTEHRLSSLRESEVAQYIRHRLSMAAPRTPKFFLRMQSPRFSNGHRGFPA
jgi:general secretion pathway protein A